MKLAAIGCLVTLGLVSVSGDSKALAPKAPGTTPPGAAAQAKAGVPGDPTPSASEVQVQLRLQLQEKEGKDYGHHHG